MAAGNNEMLLKCLELTRHIVDMGVDFAINVKFGEGRTEFCYNFEKGSAPAKNVSPSKQKRNLERKNNFFSKKLKTENEEEHIEEPMTSESPVLDVKKNDAHSKRKRIAKFKVAANMRIAAQKVLEAALSRVSPLLSKNVNYVKEESKWDLIGCDYSGEHTFTLLIDEEGLVESIMDGIKGNWRSDPLPAELVQAWLE